jgi:esterase/lipase
MIINDHKMKPFMRYRGPFTAAIRSYRTTHIPAFCSVPSTNNNTAAAAVAGAGAAASNCGIENGSESSSSHSGAKGARKAKSLSLCIGGGMRIAYQRWGAGNAHKVLCFHGWLDNSNSYNYLGPFLADKHNFDVVAVDHPGHGKSSHFHQLTSYSIFASYAYPIQEALGWSKSNVIGHSMGANMSLVFSGAFPERVEKLVLIEGIGPPTGKPENAPKNFRKAVVAEVESNKKISTGSKSRKTYNNFEEAIKSRMDAVTKYPGTQYISKEAAAAIVARYGDINVVSNYICCCYDFLNTL